MTLKNYYNILPYLIVISTFGVYVGAGLRTEHLIIYPSILLFLLLVLVKNQEMITSYFFLFFIWLAFLATSLTVSWFNSGISMNTISDAESIIQPLFLMLLLLFLPVNSNKISIEKTLVQTAKVFVFMLSLNSLFIIYSMFFDVTSLGSLIWGAEGDSSVAYNAMTNGRYSGIFNQPMEAGIAYSIGLFAWLYLSDKVNTTKLRYSLALLLMIIGGLVTVSKIFIFGGLVLFFIGVILSKNLRKRIIKLMFWSLVIAIPIYLFLFKTWIGLDYLLRFLNPSEGFLTLMTAGRFGDDSIQANYFSRVWDESPLYGRGFGATETYDSGFFQFFAVGGTIGLIMYLIILLTFIYISIEFVKQTNFGSEAKFFIFLTILIIVSSSGAPVLTLNRVSTVLWIFIGLLFQYLYFVKTSKNVSVKFDKNKKLRHKARSGNYKVV